MKSFISYSLLAAAAASSLAVAQTTATTTPVGYVTTDLPASASTLMGVTLHSSTAASGVLSAVTATSVTDSSTNFTTLLGAPSATSGTYVLELGGGVLQEVTSWSANTLTTPQSVVPYVTAGTTKYKLRKAVTISDVFGANNAAGLTATSTGNPGTYDEVLVLNAAGTAFVSCFYYNDGSFTAWYDASFNDVSKLPLVYADAIYVRRIAGAPIKLVVSGEVKTTDTVLSINTGNTFVGGVNPVGSTLGNSGLKDFLKPDTGASGATFDKVLIQQANGSYIAYNYYNDGSFSSWYDASFNDATNVPLSSGMVIQSPAAPKNIKIAVPSSYTAN